MIKECDEEDFGEDDDSDGKDPSVLINRALELQKESESSEEEQPSTAAHGEVEEAANWGSFIKYRINFLIRLTSSASHFRTLQGSEAAPLLSSLLRQRMAW